MLPDQPGRRFVAAADIAQRYHKPVILPRLNCRTVDVAAFAKSVGEEVYATADNAELERVFALLRARAAYRETRVLFPTTWFPERGFAHRITDLNHLEKRYGIGVRDGLLQGALRRDGTDPERQGSPGEGRARRRGMIKGAVQSYLDRQYVVRSLLFRRLSSL